MTVRLSGRLICTSAAEAAVVARHLPAHVALTRAEPGCLSFAVTRSADPLVWQVEESFTDRAALAAHQARTQGSEWFAQTRQIIRDVTMTED